MQQIDHPTVEQLEQQIMELNRRLAMMEASRNGPTAFTAPQVRAPGAVPSAGQVPSGVPPQVLASDGTWQGMLTAAAAQWSVVRQPWSYWCQKTDPTPEGIADSNRFNNCGAECCSMLLKYVCDVEIAAGLIKAQMVGEDYVGYLNWNNIQFWWKRYAETDSNLVVVPPSSQGRAQLEWAIWHAMMQGYTCIGLYTFTAPGSNDGHFRAITELHGMGPQLQTVVTADPWTGAKRTESADEHWSWIQNQVLIVKRKRAISV